jgi:hypothetical protein
MIVARTIRSPGRHCGRRTCRCSTRRLARLEKVMERGNRGREGHPAGARRARRRRAAHLDGAAARRRGSSLEPQVLRCEAPWVRADVIEPAILTELQACLPSGELNAVWFGT